MTDETETCLFCGATATFDNAMEAGWISEFTVSDGDAAVGPACAACDEAHLYWERGEAILKEGHAVPDPKPEPLVRAIFDDSGFTGEDVELCLSYLSEVYRKNGGVGLKVVGEGDSAVGPACVAPPPATIFPDPTEPPCELGKDRH